MLPRIAITLALLGLGVALPRVARADPAADLEKAHNAYVAHQYDEAEARLRALLDPATGTLTEPDAVADARMYLGATLVAEKKADEAAKVFSDLLSDKPEYQPDALRVSLEAVDAFTDARARNRDRIAAIQAERVRKAQQEKARGDAERERQRARLEALEKLASTETITHENSRLVALVPFGAGQLQNGDTALGWTLLVGEGLLALGSGVSAGMSFLYVAQRNDAYQKGQFDVATQYNDFAKTAAWVGDFLAGGFVAAAVAGVVQAQLAFVPETVTVRKRELPVLSLTPVVGPGGVGVVGSF